MQITAFVLAGGQSSRMGTDKAFLQRNGRSLLEHALSLAGLITPDVRIVGQAEKLRSQAGTAIETVPVVQDIYPDRGPLGGIHAALRSSSTEMNLILAVDMPFATERWLQFLIQTADDSGAQITLPRTGGRWQPLCAVYRRQFAEVAESALKAGHNRLDALFSLVPVRTIEEEELRAMAFDSTMFENLNTPGDWKRAQGRRAEA